MLHFSKIVVVSHGFTMTKNPLETSTKRLLRVAGQQRLFFIVI